ncbi:MAG: hypothetical protein O3B85_02045 [Planctomycetota bacterium]|nr:hypothetical protein [Planctomycetota bacterium]
MLGIEAVGREADVRPALQLLDHPVAAELQPERRQVARLVGLRVERGLLDVLPELLAVTAGGRGHDRLLGDQRPLVGRPGEEHAVEQLGLLALGQEPLAVHPELRADRLPELDARVLQTELLDDSGDVRDHLVIGDLEVLRVAPGGDQLLDLLRDEQLGDLRLDRLGADQEDRFAAEPVRGDLDAVDLHRPDRLAPDLERLVLGGLDLGEELLDLLGALLGCGGAGDGNRPAGGGEDRDCERTARTWGRLDRHRIGAFGAREHNRVREGFAGRTAGMDERTGTRLRAPPSDRHIARPA